MLNFTINSGTNFTCQIAKFCLKFNTREMFFTLKSIVETFFIFKNIPAINISHHNEYFVSHSTLINY